MTIELEERVDSLETILGQFIVQFNNILLFFENIYDVPKIVQEKCVF